MAFRGLVNRNVEKAFNTLGDLVIDVTLVSQNATGYDFDAGETETSSIVTTVIKGVLIEKKHVQSTRSRLQGKINATISIDLLVKTADIEHPDVYDHVIINGLDWEIFGYEGNEYIYTLNLVREGVLNV